jgi:DNA damage-inducible protein 1
VRQQEPHPTFDEPFSLQVGKTLKASRTDADFRRAKACLLNLVELNPAPLQPSSLPQLAPRAPLSETSSFPARPFALKSSPELCSFSFFLSLSIKITTARPRGPPSLVARLISSSPDLCHSTHNVGLANTRKHEFHPIISPLTRSFFCRRITLSITLAEPSQGDDQDLLSLEVYPDMTLETLRSSVHAETGFEPSSQHLYHNGQLITDNSKTLTELQIGDGEMLALHVRELRGTTGIPAESANAPAQQGASRGGARAPAPQQDPELVRLQILGNPSLRAELTRQRPELAAAVDDPRQFGQIWAQSYDRERRERAARHQQIQMLNSDPFNPEAQAKIEEMIRQERVMENLQNAMEHNPEGRFRPTVCSR